MIEVTRLNGNPMILNSDLIKIAESSPDTMLTLIQGEKLIVRESCAEIVEKVLAYRARLLVTVSARTEAPGDLHRLVALASLKLESTQDSTTGPSATRSGAGLAGRNSLTLVLDSNGEEPADG